MLDFWQNYRSRTHLITAIIGKISTRASPRCFNHCFNAGLLPRIYWGGRLGAARPAGGWRKRACSRSRYILPFPPFFSPFSAVAYLRGLVIPRRYYGIHVPADRENCDYLRRLGLFLLAMRSRDSTLAHRGGSGTLSFFLFLLTLFQRNTESRRREPRYLQAQRVACVQFYFSIKYIYS